MRRSVAIPATILAATALSLLLVVVAATMLAPGWSFDVEAAHEGGTIELAALDMDTTGNTVAQSPSGNVEETTLGTIENCIAVTHPAIFIIDFVVQGYPPASDSLVGFDVSLTFPAGLTLNNTFAGDVAPSILGRTLISGDPQSGPFTSFVDTPNINNPTPRVGPDTHAASVLDFADADPNEDIDGEEFQGLPLTTIIRHRFEPGPDMRPGLRGENSVTFIYGDCTPTGDSGCPPPVQVIVEAYCTRPPELLAEEVKDGPPIDLRGALAQPLVPDQVMAWTGDARVTVFDVRGGGVALATMEALTAVTGTGAGPGQPLPPPDPNSC